MVEDFKETEYNNDELLQNKNEAIEHFNNLIHQNECEVITFIIHYLRDFRKLLKDSEAGADRELL